MNFESLEDRSYFYTKLFQAVLYAQDIKGFIDDLEVNEIEFIDAEALSAANHFFSKYAANTKLSLHNINNIFHFANYCRFHDKANKDRKTIFSHCNQMTTFAIKLNHNPSDDGYRSEVLRRHSSLRDRMLMLAYLASNLEETKRLINYSIQLDFWILLTHSDCYDDEDFKCCAIEAMLAESTYLHCIEQFLHQRPQLFKNEVFVSRVLEVLNANEHMLAEINGISTKDECMYEPSDEEDVDTLTDKVFIKKNRALKNRLIEKKDS